MSWRWRRSTVGLWRDQRRRAHQRTSAAASAAARFDAATLECIVPQIATFSRDPPKAGAWNVFQQGLGRVSCCVAGVTTEQLTSATG